MPAPKADWIESWLTTAGISMLPDTAGMNHTTGGESLSKPVTMALVPIALKVVGLPQARHNTGPLAVDWFSTSCVPIGCVPEASIMYAKLPSGVTATLVGV